MPYPCRRQQKCGDGKPSPYSVPVVDALGEALVCRGGQGDAAHGLYIDLDLVAHAHEHAAGISHPPIHVRNQEMSGGGQLVTVPGRRDCDVEIVFDSVQLERATQLQRRLSFGFQAPVDVGGDEHGFRELAGVQDFSLDFTIHRSVITLLACHVDNYRAVGFSRSRVEADRPAFQFEGPVNRANNARQGELNLRLRRVEFEDRFLRRQGEGQGKCKNECNPNESVS
ncbi:hypothetical protein SBA2_450020 [Acidobacteriia bacterium SbA2]|nr:hypothetical protein SBA2_450020 [Acidobacteriia bacterium SbA2]